MDKDEFIFTKHASNFKQILYSAFLHLWLIPLLLPLFSSWRKLNVIMSRRKMAGKDKNAASSIYCDKYIRRLLEGSGKTYLIFHSDSNLQEVISFLPSMCVINLFIPSVSFESCHLDVTTLWKIAEELGACPDPSVLRCRH